MNEAMQKTTAYIAYIYSSISVMVFGMLGNILVIISLARQKQLLKKNYYFLVLHLAVCDLGAFVFKLLVIIVLYLDVAHDRAFKIVCFFSSLRAPFYSSGLAMMLMISVLRYRAIVHPLKPAICRAKLIKVCYITYVVGLMLAVGSILVPYCLFIEKLNYLIYEKFVCVFDLLHFWLAVIFMVVCYCKIGRALVKQNKQMKRIRVQLQ